jgi:hypothetical protein
VSEGSQWQRNNRLEAINKWRIKAPYHFGLTA